MNRSLIAVCTRICAQSYEKRRAFIVAENPMQTTVEAFWQMIWEQKCVLVITFSDGTEICEVCIYTNCLSIYQSIYMVVFAHIELNASPLSGELFLLLANFHWQQQHAVWLHASDQVHGSCPQ